MAKVKETTRVKEVRYFHYADENGNIVDLDLVFNEDLQMYEVRKPKSSVIVGKVLNEVVYNSQK